VIRVWAEVEPGPGLAAQRRGEPADEVLRLDQRDLLAMFRERESRGEPADTAAYDDRVTQRDTSVRTAWDSQVIGLACPERDRT
jgi:hypothetical protein